jgi:hypothetical protein
MDGLMAPEATFTFDVRDRPPIELAGVEQLVTFGSAACEPFAFYLYQPLNTVVTASDEETAAGRSYALEVGVERSTGAWCEFYGRYDDDHRLTADGWRFVSRRFQLLARRVDGITTSWPEDVG